MYIQMAQNPNKKFTVEGRYFLLTYKSHVPKDWLINHLTMVIQNLKPGVVVEVVVAHEIGNIAMPYNHTHAAVKINAQIRNQKNDACHMFCLPCQEQSLLDGCGMVHPNIKPVKGGMKGWRDTLGYIGKEDAECRKLCETLINDKTTVRDLCSGFRPDQAMEFLASASVKDIVQYKAMVDSGVFSAMAERPDAKVVPLIYEWQQYWYWTMIQWLHDKRIVGVIVDPIGNNGKSDLTKYAGVTLNRDCLVVRYKGRNNDMMCMIGDDYLSGRWTGKCIFIDVSRPVTDWDGVYTTLEELKDGRLYSTKYHGCNELLPFSPSITMLCNNYPDIFKLSEDRWAIYALDSWEEEHDNPGITNEYIEASQDNPYKKIINDGQYTGELLEKLTRHKTRGSNKWKKRHNTIREISVHECERLREEQELLKAQRTIARMNRLAGEHSPGDVAPTLYVSDIISM